MIITNTLSLTKNSYNFIYSKSINNTIDYRGIIVNIFFMNQKYTKEEHLKGYKLIKYLFEEGAWYNKYPLKIIYCPSPEPLKFHKVGVSVSKRNFKYAVDRNRIKRLLRECYRLHKNELYDTFFSPHLLMIVYYGKEIPSYNILSRNYLRLLEKIKSS